MSKDVFEQVPEFQAAFNHIQEHGFFENMQLNLGCPLYEGRLMSCSIKATGCIPNDPQYAAEGCGTLVDTEAVLTACRELAKKQPVKSVTTEVETVDWQLFDDAGVEVVGSKGRRTEMYILIMFEYQ